MDRKASLTDLAYGRLKDEIINCTLQPGRRLAQRELVQRYGLGTTPVREALQRLAREGLVQTIPRFGYLVTPITLSDVREIYELRTVLESAAARLAASRATEQELEGLSQQADFAYVYRDRQSYSAFLAQNAAFHRAVALLAGNKRLAEQVSRLLDEMTRIFHLGLDVRDSAAEMRDEHLALVEALQRRDAALAERVMRSQITRSQERVLEALTGASLPGERTIQVIPPRPSSAQEAQT